MSLYPIHHGGPNECPKKPGATTFPIYIPDFLEEYSLSEQSLEQQKNELLQQKDWLTSGLIREIE
jgi:hypothetical protein